MYILKNHLNKKFRWQKLSRLGFIWFLFQELIYNFYSDYVNIEYDRVYKILQKYLEI